MTLLTQNTERRTQNSGVRSQQTGDRTYYSGIAAWHGRAAWVLLVVCGVACQAGESAQPGTGASQFAVKFDAGAIVSLARTGDASSLDYVGTGRRLGDVAIRYRQGSGEWQTVQTASLAREGSGAFTAAGDGNEVKATYPVAGDSGPVMTIENRFSVRASAIEWTCAIQNMTDQALEIGDLAVPLAVGRMARQGPPMLKHSFVSGHGSFLFWMRGDSVGPHLTLTPSAGTSFEYWDADRQAGYRVYIHSAAAATAAQERGTKWRQPSTSLTLSPKGRAGDSRSYGWTLHWADGYEAVRQLLVDQGGVDVSVVPGMTVPTELSSRVALRTRQSIEAVEAEFPANTQIESLGTKGDVHLYAIRFARLGENRITVRYAKDRHLFLEFFCTEPIETLIAKRAAFISRCQHRDPSKWYNGLISEWNMETGTLLGPDNYDRIKGWRIYEVTCDDPGLCKPAFLAAKNAEYPVQSEVAVMDYYLQHFVWGGLQRTTEETYPYGIYGIPDWKQNRDSNDVGPKGRLHLWRIYDYPHVVVMYLSMYRVARNHPQIKTALPAGQYLQRAYGTALAMFTVPSQIDKGWSPYETGFYNELVIVDLIDEIEAAGMKAEAQALRDHWERKVRSFVNEKQDLFRSEYAFDSTGFESTHALARYAVQHAAAGGKTGVSPESARRFMETQMAANLFCRGTIEPAYYLLGSDYRGSGGNSYTLTYMSQMGGWAVLDYGLHFAAGASPYLRLGYASYLSAWALMNTGTPESSYGYWYPGKANDGGAGGGFEPAAYGQTWLGQPHHRGSWYYACEIDLGYCGALRTAATILTDDPIFGRICLGGDWRKGPDGIEVTSRDGLRRRFHAMLGSRRLHLISDVDRFPAARPIVLKEDLSEVSFSLESDNPSDHCAKVHIGGLVPGRYAIRSDKTLVTTVDLKAGQETLVELPMKAETRPGSFVILLQSEAQQ